jgi:hypothetical protein
MPAAEGITQHKNQHILIFIVFAVISGGCQPVIMLTTIISIAGILRSETPASVGV